MIKSKKIIVISGFWPTNLNSISGIFVVQQIAALSRAGYHVTVILPLTIGRRAAHYCSMAELGLDASSVLLVKLFVFRIPENFSSLPGAIRLNTILLGVAIDRCIQRLQKVEKFYGCIIHGVRYAGLSMPMWKHLIDGFSVIVIHGVDPFMVKSRNYKQIKSLCIEVSAVSNIVVLVGNPLKAHAISLGFSANKLQVVPNGTDLPPENLISAEQRTCVQTRRVVSVSNLIPLKGVDDNLRALALVNNRRPDLKWVYRIVGDGPYLSELEKLAKDLGIDGKVLFVGRFEYKKTMQEIAECDIFSLPSWGEAFGIVYLEAMARMRPVIGCYENGAADILTDKVEGRLIAPHDVLGLADALTDLLEDPVCCARMGRAGRITAESMSWDENAKRMIRLSEDIKMSRNLI